MKKRVKTSLLLAVILILTMALTSCDGHPGEVTINVYLVNSSAETYNLWIGHSSEINPVNDVASGSSNVWTVTLKANGYKEDRMDKIDDKILVNVAKDGGKVTADKVFVQRKYTDGMTLSIVWDGKSLSLQD